jgi:sugar phosphate isomerase/epimerase
MNLSFSTLACPEWTMSQIISIASTAGYNAIELRFVENEDSLWKLPAFRGNELAAIKQALADEGLQISCVDTSCRFHFPDPHERKHWLEEGERMADLAASLGAPGIRVFGDKIQPNADRFATRAWIAESVHDLAEKIAANDVEVWLETHGDFAVGAETAAIIAKANSSNVGVIWDPANCFLESGERPDSGASLLGTCIRHVHLKDLCKNNASWQPVLTGQGNFPLTEVRTALNRVEYRGTISFEWEKKWHPDIPDASIALPHFAKWFRENWYE